MTSGQRESLQRELGDARQHAAQLQEKLNSIEESPGWRVVTAYRNFLNKGRVVAPVIDGVARLGIRLFSSKGETIAAPEPTVEAPSPAVPAAKGILLHCLDPGYMGRVFYCRDGKRHWIHRRCGKFRRPRIAVRELSLARKPVP